VPEIHSLPNGLRFSREPRENFFEPWNDVARGSAAGAWCFASSSGAPAFVLLSTVDTARMMLHVQRWKGGEDRIVSKLALSARQLFSYNPVRQGRL